MNLKFGEIKSLGFKLSVFAIMRFMDFIDLIDRYIEDIIFLLIQKVLWYVIFLMVKLVIKI